MPVDVGQRVAVELRAVDDESVIENDDVAARERAELLALHEIEREHGRRSVVRVVRLGAAAVDDRAERARRVDRRIDAGRGRLDRELEALACRLDGRTLRASCECADYRAGVVCDIFLGSGTTVAVAPDRL